MSDDSLLTSADDFLAKMQEIKKERQKPFSKNKKEETDEPKRNLYPDRGNASSDHPSPSGGFLDRSSFSFDGEPPVVIFNFGDETKDALEASLISYIEFYYQEHGNIPGIAELQEEYRNNSKAPKTPEGWKNKIEELGEFLDARGLPTYRTAENYLDPLFLSACITILNPSDRRSDAAKLKELGISSHRWDRWLKRAPYFAYYKEQASKVYDDTEPELKRQLSNLVRSGDLSAIKYYDERTGAYRSNQAGIELMPMFIQAIMSILARNVSAEIINTISAELREEPVVKRAMGILIEAQEAS